MSVEDDDRINAEDPLGGADVGDLPSAWQCYNERCWAAWNCGNGICLRQEEADRIALAQPAAESETERGG